MTKEDKSKKAVIQPCGNRIIIKILKSEVDKIGGIHIIGKGQPEHAIIVATGTHLMNEHGITRTPDFFQNDRIIIRKGAGIEFPLEGQILRIIQPEDVIVRILTLEQMEQAEAAEKEAERIYKKIQKEEKNANAPVH